ncbi:4Fe-4S binding protein [Desulfogranum mediterraneum]|uniref:4Fe-4S binding protein n=1 Tax=Desulfogranum mediterraneum TaxID=160661 RepID=UPI0004129999|nr:4Fe-4S binding protein [Desulfogranum mediterraneum]
MNSLAKTTIPAVIGTVVGGSLYAAIGWWGFLLVFPWIGAAVSLGIHLQQRLKDEKKLLGRKVCILLILPALLMFVPLANRENFQLEGVILIILAGYFSKGFIHYAVAKIFGPLLWGRGFCGWACWTAAVLDWLPITRHKRPTVSEKLKNIRYLSLFLSIIIPVAAIYVVGYDVKGSYIGKAELTWMMAGNLVYYLLAILLAFYFTDQRAFCKILCPVSLVMKVPSQFACNRKQPTKVQCIECGLCNDSCPMDVDVMSYITRKSPVADTECISCNSCKVLCPVSAIR